MPTTYGPWIQAADHTFDYYAASEAGHAADPGEVDPQFNQVPSSGAFGIYKYSTFRARAHGSLSARWVSNLLLDAQDVAGPSGSVDLTTSNAQDVAIRAEAARVWGEAASWQDDVNDPAVDDFGGDWPAPGTATTPTPMYGRTFQTSSELTLYYRNGVTNDGSGGWIFDTHFRNIAFSTASVYYFTPGPIAGWKPYDAYLYQPDGADVEWESDTGTITGCSLRVKWSVTNYRQHHWLSEFTSYWPHVDVQEGIVGSTAQVRQLPVPTVVDDGSTVWPITLDPITDYTTHPLLLEQSLDRPGSDGEFTVVSDPIDLMPHLDSTKSGAILVSLNHHATGNPPDLGSWNLSRVMMTQPKILAGADPVSGTLLAWTLRPPRYRYVYSSTEVASVASASWNLQRNDIAGYQTTRSAHFSPVMR